jgi:hypothetical protein
MASSSEPAVVLAADHIMNITASKIDLEALIIFAPSSVPRWDNDLNESNLLA